VDDSYTADHKAIIVQTASVFNIPPDRLAAAIADLQHQVLDEPPIPRKYKPRPNRKTKMPPEYENADKQRQRSPPGDHKSPKGLVSRLNPQMPKPWQSDINEQRISTGPSNSATMECFGMKFVPSAVADCFASLMPYDESSNREQMQGLSGNNPMHK